jgi:AcrR family transcriptional regulator
VATRAPNARKNATRERILDAAARLFAERGFDGASLRAITDAAGVNLAAVHYHLGSKEELLAAVLARHAEPINRERLARLTALEAGGAAPRVEEILAAFLAPALDRSRRDPELRDVIVLVQGEPVERAAPLFRAQFGEVIQRFGDALCAALPEIPAAVVRERLHFAVGALLHVLAGRPQTAFRGALGIGDDAALVQRLAAFLAAGFRAPATRVRRGRDGRPADRRDAP